MEKYKSLAVLILAAGSSNRLGEPKQLLKYEGSSLLELSVKNALNLTKNVFVVLGHKEKECKEEIKKYSVNTVFNRNHELGMGTSISFGIKYTKYFDNTLIMLCDQPFIPLEHFKALIKKADNKNIICSLYEHNSKKSVPAIFPKNYYEKLEKLDKDFGAKFLLKENKTIDVKLKERFTIDIDTKEDANKFLNL
ncbi:4-diphosphocytidyl-2C-methyl-D-erythritol synthase [Halarcobacter ebronensis]|uniref:4-diphosphocytidyl-2C-methyl-D-erythritol synthase n=1 Tax=Halarcobacter ebronensis TaxID=1462615 RepID=A0A4V1LRS7_9BACT|nr:nucleotidyltransferase family protein [Halarcobacter ebronensis]RXJ69238.1 4-diphosphocytidyl-2C-methyl-D-erythritol synthase [Halarcobacter ebronensis]